MVQPFLDNKVIQALVLAILFACATSMLAPPLRSRVVAGIESVTRVLVKLESAGASRRVVSLTVPTGYSFNLDGTCIYLTMAAMFIAQVGGVQLSLRAQLGLLGLMLLMSKGAAGVTGASLITFAASLEAFGPEFFPPHALAIGLALVVGIDRVMSEGKALTSTIGVAAGTMIIAKLAGKRDDARFRTVLDHPNLLRDSIEPAVTHHAVQKACPEPAPSTH